MNEKSPHFSKEKDIIIQKNDTLQRRNTYRLSSHLCDVILVTEGREFPAHRAVLAAGGGFFSGLFASNMKEKAESKIELPQVDQEIMDDILGYIYTGQIRVTQENAQLVIMAADFLLIEELKQPVDEFLAHVSDDCSLSPHESASTLQFANDYSCTLLAKMAFKQVCKNFEAIVNESQELFLELSTKSISDIISSDDVVVSSEEKVFRAVMKWVKHKKERKQLLTQLLPHIRLCSLSTDFIHSVVLADPLVASSPGCVRVVRKGMNISYDPTIPNATHPRDCLDTYTNVILVIPQDHYQYDCRVPEGVWCYLPTTHSWFQIPTLQKFGLGVPFDCQCGVTTVYEEVSKTFVDRYNIRKNAWSPVIDNWECPFWDHGITYLNNVVYLVGGTKPNEDNGMDVCPSGDVFVCDLQAAEPSFKQVASLNTARFRPYVLSDGHYVYAFGEEPKYYDSNSRTDTMERYDPEANTWSYLSPVQFSKVGGSPHQCTLVDGKIFVIQMGTEDDEHEFDLMYEISKDTWSKIPPAPLRALYGLLTHSKGWLYLICGGNSEYEDESFDKGSIIKTVSYDLTENVWSDVAPSLELNLIDYDGITDGWIPYICLAGTVVRLRKDFVSTLQLLENVQPSVPE